jgi:caffeoyl-CoA O-methyltransferase
VIEPSCTLAKARHCSVAAAKLPATELPLANSRQQSLSNIPAVSGSVNLWSTPCVKSFELTAAPRNSATK